MIKKILSVGLTTAAIMAGAQMAQAQESDLSICFAYQTLETEFWVAQNLSP